MKILLVCALLRFITEHDLGSLFDCNECDNIRFCPNEYFANLTCITTSNTNFTLFPSGNYSIDRTNYMETFDSQTGYIDLIPCGNSNCDSNYTPGNSTQNEKWAGNGCKGLYPGLECCSDGLNNRIRKCYKYYNNGTYDTIPNNGQMHQQKLIRIAILSALLGFITEHDLGSLFDCNECDNIRFCPNGEFANLTCIITNNTNLTLFASGDYRIDRTNSMGTIRSLAGYIEQSSCEDSGQITCGNSNCDCNYIPGNWAGNGNGCTRFHPRLVCFTDELQNTIDKCYKYYNNGTRQTIPNNEPMPTTSDTVTIIPTVTTSPTGTTSPTVATSPTVTSPTETTSPTVTTSPTGTSPTGTSPTVTSTITSPLYETIITLSVVFPLLLLAGILILAIAITIIILYKLRNKQTENKESFNTLVRTEGSNMVNLELTHRADTIHTYQQIDTQIPLYCEIKVNRIPEEPYLYNSEYGLVRNELYAGFVEGEVANVRLYEELSQLKNQTNPADIVIENPLYNTRFNPVSQKSICFVEPPASLPELESDLKCCPFELKREELEIGEQFASGHFGIVYRATYQTERGDIPVAVKTLKESASSLSSVLRSSVTIIKGCCSVTTPISRRTF